MPDVRGKDMNEEIKLPEELLDTKNWASLVKIEGPLYGVRVGPLCWFAQIDPKWPSHMRDAYDYKWACVFQRETGWN
jgi:hypothetical protein